MKTTILIFGITGDLSSRKLLPALEKIVSTGDFDELEIIGISRREVDVDHLLSNAKASQLADRLSIYSMDLAEASQYDKLKDHIKLGPADQLLAYLAVPPLAATQIVDFMGQAGINQPNVKILFEKPFGVDYESAVDIIERTGRYFEEEQLYRIDHYLAKEMAQNIMAIRGGNALFGHVWTAQAIESIEVVAAEEIGIESRGSFYDQTGALRDVLQGHLLQLLALTLMEVPAGFDWQAIPEARLAALQSLQPADPTLAVRAQYAGYDKAVDNPGSLTETFASITLYSTNPTWTDVPMTLITGKALDTKLTQIRVYLRRQHDAQSNIIEFRIQPDEGISIELYSKKPGYNQVFETRRLGFSYQADEQLPEAYEQVLVDAIRSRKSLFTSSPEVLRSWQLLAPVQQAWSMDDQPLYSYAAGSAVDQVLEQIKPVADSTTAND